MAMVRLGLATLLAVLASGAIAGDAQAFAGFRCGTFDRRAGQRDGKDGARPVGAVGRNDGAAMRVDDLLADGEAEA